MSSLESESDTNIDTIITLTHGILQWLIMRKLQGYGKMICLLKSNFSVFLSDRSEEADLLKILSRDLSTSHTSYDKA